MHAAAGGGARADDNQLRLTQKDVIDGVAVTDALFRVRATPHPGDARLSGIALQRHEPSQQLLVKRAGRVCVLCGLLVTGGP